MIEALLPAKAVVVEAFDDSIPAPLFAEEEVFVAKAVPKRRDEFATGRRCAREALAALGFAAAPLLVGAKREPLWPDGVVGSITHCVGYRAAAVARELAGLGIDAEPNEPLPEGVLESIALPQEQDHLELLGEAYPALQWDRMLFSAKESVYKVWFPLARRWLDFKQAEIVFDPAAATFTATILIEGPIGVLPGRFVAGRGLVVTAISVAR